MSKETERLLKNMQAQIALQQEALNIVYRKAATLLNREEREQLNTCQTAFAALLDQNTKIMEAWNGK